MTGDLTRTTAAELADLLEAGEATSVEITRAHLDRIDAVDPGVHAFLQVDRGFPAEDLPCPRDVGTAHPRIVHRQRLVHDLARGARDADARLGELEHRDLVVGVADVHRQMLVGHRE